VQAVKKVGRLEQSYSPLYKRFIALKAFEPLNQTENKHKKGVSKYCVTLVLVSFYLVSSPLKHVVFQHPCIALKKPYNLEIHKSWWHVFRSEEHTSELQSR